MTKARSLSATCANLLQKIQISHSQGIYTFQESDKFTDGIAPNHAMYK